MDYRVSGSHVYPQMNTFVFGDIPREYSTYEHARAVVLPVPYERTTSYVKGTGRGPEAILEASYQIELFDEKLKQEIFKMGIHTLPFMSVTPHPEQFLNQVEAEVSFHLRKNKLPVILGGEHTVTLGAIKAVKQYFPHIGVLQIDAHADLRDSYQEDPYSHACVMRRVLAYAPLFQIGIRSLSQEEFHLIKEERVTTVFSHEMTKETIEDLIAKLPEEVYLTIDMDGFDPAVVPGVGNPEPGGIDWKMADYIVDRVSSRSRIRGLDIVELRPIPGEVRSEVTAARLLYRVLGYIARDQSFF